MQAMIVIHETIVQIAKNFFGQGFIDCHRHNRILSSLNNNCWNIYWCRQIIHEFREHQSGGEQNLFADLRGMPRRKQGSHQASEGRANQSPVGCAAEDWIKLLHPFVNRTGKVRHEQVRIDCTNQCGFISLAVAFQSVKVDQAFCVKHELWRAVPDAGLNLVWRLR